MALGQHTQSDDVGQHTGSNDVGRGMPSYPRTLNTVERRQACHAIISLGKHTRSDDIGRGMLLLP